MPSHEPKVTPSSGVSATLDGSAAASHIYNAVVTDGAFGLASYGGATEFDYLTVRSDDPSLSTSTTSQKAAVIDWTATELPTLSASSWQSRAMWQLDFVSNLGMTEQSLMNERFVVSL